MTTAPDRLRDRTNVLLNGGIAVTFTLSLLGNLVRTIVEDRSSALLEGPRLVLIAVPGVLFLVLAIARLGLPLLRRIRARRNEPS